MFEHRRDRAKQAISLFVRTGCEVERVGTRFRAAAEGQRPQPVDDQRLIMRVIELIQEMTLGVVNIDFAVAEVADEDVAAEAAKGEGRPHDSPGRIQLAAGGEAPEQMTIRVEDVDKAVARAGDVVMFLRVLLGIGHEQVAIDVLYAEWRVAGRDRRILEAPAGGCRNVMGQ